MQGVVHDNYRAVFLCAVLYLPCSKGFLYLLTRSVSFLAGRSHLVLNRGIAESQTQCNAYHSVESLDTVSPPILLILPQLAHQPFPKNADDHYQLWPYTARN